MDHSLKKLAVVTGSRAEYGLLKPVIKKLLERKDIDTHVVVTGAHLSERYGMTVSEIEKDGIPIAARVDILRFEDSETRISDTVSYAISEYTRTLKEMKPDCVLVLGDRYEIFAFVLSASILGIPVAHISGGDVTLGSADDWYRHCITKMSALHFPACADSRGRLIRMGEAPERVFLVGGLGDENIRSTPLMDEKTLSKSTGFDLSRTFALVTYHPETDANACDPAEGARSMLSAMEILNKESGLVYLITESNADNGGAAINEQLHKWNREHSDISVVFSSLGSLRYLSAMSLASLVLGNSSSGVVETPSFRVPCVNIGSRQTGREVCANVICCGGEIEQITEAMRKAISDEFREIAAKTVSPYYGENTSGDIAEITVSKINSGFLKQTKSFYDLI